MTPPVGYNSPNSGVTAMTATIDSEGRIQLAPDVQRQLGVKPGDELAIENRNGQWVLSPVGLVTENGVLVHRGTSPVAVDDLLSQLRDDRFASLSEGVS